MMKGHARIMVFMLLVGLLVMTGCEKKYTASSADTEDSGDTESDSVMTEQVSETESVLETNPATVTENVEPEKVTEPNTQSQKDFESSLGYHIIYDQSLFEYNRTGDYDEIAMKGQTFSMKPIVFFAAMKIENDDVENIIGELFDESAENTTIGKEAYPALCQPTEEATDGGKGTIHHNQYLVRLANGDSLLFETQWYEEEDDDQNGKYLDLMLESIIIDEPVPGSLQELEQPDSHAVESDDKAEAEASEIN